MNNPKISIILVYSNQGEEIKNSLDKLVNQSFDSFEIICVNSNSDEETINNVSDYAKNSKNIKLINLPNNNDEVAAKQAAFNIASGDMVCFVEANNDFSSDFIQKLYYEKLNSDKNKRNFECCKLYNRDFLEKSTDIDEIIQEKVNIEVQKFFEILKGSEQNVKQELDNCYRNSENTVNNKVYDLNVRFNNLEKVVYDKEAEIQSNAHKLIESALNDIYSNNSKIYDDISKIYDFINGEVNQKGNEINKIYEEITNNYHYTEKLVEEIKQNLYYEVDKLYKNLDEIIKDNELRYSHLQRVIDVMADEMKDRMQSLGVVSGSDSDEISSKIADLINLERNIKNNFDKLYLSINENNSKFYEELSKLYKEINEKINRN